MSRSSSSRRRRQRAQAEPIVALAAVLALSLGLSAYAVVLNGVAEPSGPTAEPTLERVHDRLTVGGVAKPDRLVGSVRSAALGERQVNATLTASGRRWTAGDSLPDSVGDASDRASRRIGVALSPGRVRPGDLRVTVWR